MKKLLVTSLVLAYHDPKQPLALSCDASQYGLGAVLFNILPNGVEKHAFASMTLSQAEPGYAQIKQEALAIIFAFKKFHCCLYGLAFTLFTDHQPVIGILGPRKQVPSFAAARMQR